MRPTTSPLPNLKPASVRPAPWSSHCSSPYVALVAAGAHVRERLVNAVRQLPMAGDVDRIDAAGHGGSREWRTAVPVVGQRAGRGHREPPSGYGGSVLAGSLYRPDQVLGPHF